MPDASARQLLADAIRGQLLDAHHGAEEIDVLVDRVLGCVEDHNPHAELLAELDTARDRASDLASELDQARVMAQAAIDAPGGCPSERVGIAMRLCAQLVEGSAGAAAPTGPSTAAEPVAYTTVECTRPGETYTLIKRTGTLDVHLAGPGRSGGTGPCICGFDRHADGVGFSVGGGVTGPGVQHQVCTECARLAGPGATIRGTHADLFAVTGTPREDNPCA